MFGIKIGHEASGSILQTLYLKNWTFPKLIKFSIQLAELQYVTQLVHGVQTA